VRVGNLVLAVESPRATAALDPPPAILPFLARRGADIRLSFTADAPPRPRGRPLFDSGGVWRVYRHPEGLLYQFRLPQGRPPVYKAVVIDEDLGEGRVHFPPREGGPAYALEYPLDELLFQHRLAREGALEVHACGVDWQGRAVVLCGQSGAGKSTTARLWQRHARRTSVLSDDRIILRPSSRGARAWGTPWHGDGGFASPGSRPLAALFFLRHARRTTVRLLGRAEAAARLLARGFPPPWDAVAMTRALETCATVTAGVPAYELAFRPDRTAVQAVRETLAAPAYRERDPG
jgi:hypothetical protein